MRFILGRRIEQSARRLNDARWARPIDSKANMKRRRTWCHGLREVKRIRKVKKEKKKRILIMWSLQVGLWSLCIVVKQASFLLKGITH